MIENPIKGMYVYFVGKNKQEILVIKKHVLLDSKLFVVGTSSDYHSVIGVLRKADFDRMYWETPEEAFNNWKNDGIKARTKLLKKVVEHYKEQSNLLKSDLSYVKTLSFGDLEIEMDL